MRTEERLKSSLHPITLRKQVPNRIPVNGIAYFCAHGISRSRQLSNLSESGVYIADVTARPPLGTPLDLVLRTDAGVTCFVRGIVVRRDEQGFAAHFSGPTAQLGRLLRACLLAAVCASPNG